MAMDLLEALRGAEKAQISTVQSFPCESAARLEEPAQYWQGSGRKRGKRRVCDWSGWMPIIIITKTKNTHKQSTQTTKIKTKSTPVGFKGQATRFFSLIPHFVLFSLSLYLMHVSIGSSSSSISVSPPRPLFQPPPASQSLFIIALLLFSAPEIAGIA
jgi:hypothetical protein